MTYSGTMQRLKNSTDHRLGRANCLRCQYDPPRSRSAVLRTLTGHVTGALKRGTIPVSQVGGRFIAALQELKQHRIG
ncbi:MAG: hypothetical protein JWQ21_538 [Herminiimonas sp.]|nr:hypothetical protein [Herminiimonas sp.]